MTDVLEKPADTDESADETETESTGAKRGRKRDFTKSSEYYDNLAAFINEHSGLDPVSPLQVKAAYALRADYANLPDQKAERDKRAAEKKEQEKKYDGLTEAQKTAQKLADRTQAQAAKLQAKADEALAAANKLRESSDASGEDLAAVVGEAQESAEAKPRKGLRR